MRTEAYRGFVLKSVALSTHRHILVAFTEKGGKRQGVFRVGKANPRAYLTPLTLLSFQLRGKEQQALPTLLAPNLERHHFDFAADFLGLTLLSHWALLVDACQPEAQEDERVFRLLNHSLLSLDSNRIRALPAQNLYFELWLLHFAGVLPRVRAQTARITEDSTASGGRDLESLYEELNQGLLAAVFQQKIEDFVEVGLQCGALARETQILERIWVHFLGRNLKSHSRLLDRYKERGLQ